MIRTSAGSDWSPATTYLASCDGSSIRPRRVRPNFSPCSPSISRWSNVTDIGITGRATTLPSRTTARSSISPKPTIATSGGRISDVPRPAPRAGVADGESSALEVRQGRLTLAGRCGHALDLEGQIVERELVGLLDHGHDQPIAGRGGDTDVDVIVHHDLPTFFVERCVEDGVPADRQSRGTNEKGVEWEPLPSCLGGLAKFRDELRELCGIQLGKPRHMGDGSRGQRHRLGHSLLHATQAEAVAARLRGNRPRAGRAGGP